MSLWVKDLEEKGAGAEYRGRAVGPYRLELWSSVPTESESMSYDLLEAHHITVVDATCPFVKKIHRIVEEQTGAGRRVIIIGSPDHPEVQGIRGWGNDTTLVVEKPEQIDDLPVGKDEKTMYRFPNDI